MVKTQGSRFVDEHGRTLILRGVNLGGSSKVPFTPNGATYRREGFFEHRTVSFIGRPFPLCEAQEHFTRLRAWGFTFLRFLVTWEAIEHAGPGRYDEDYIDYLHEVLSIAAGYGISVFIDPHEDVWSRFCGGDGAPGWTHEAVGMDLTRIQETGAAIVHNLLGDPFPRMIWSTNTDRLASATMFALFFAGNDLAPKTFVAGEPVQEYLQRHYLAAMRHLTARLKDLPNIVGFDTLNEPRRGYIETRDLNDYSGRFNQGISPTPFQAMLMACGHPTEVAHWNLGLSGYRVTGKVLVNPEGQRLWLDGYDCVWRQNGVWDYDAQGKPQLLRRDHFARVNGRKIDFVNDYFKPFARRVIAEIRAEMPQAVLFIEAESGGHPPKWDASESSGIVYAPHYYDMVVLMLKRFFPYIAVDFFSGMPVFLPGFIRRSFRMQLSQFTHHARQFFGEVPVLVGEIGVPFDLDHKKSFRNGDFSVQERAMDRSMQALDDNLLSATLWNYTADNTNERGDQWNDEDLSIFSLSQRSDPADINSGGRALRAVVRPYPRATAGMPLKMNFNRHTRTFVFSFLPDGAIQAPTEIFIPAYHYPSGIRVLAPEGTWEYRPGESLLLIRPQNFDTAYHLRVDPANA